MKVRSVAWTAEAGRQLEEAADYYGGQRPGLDLTLERAAERASELMGHTPHAGSIVEEARDLGEVRRFPLRPFPIDVVFLVRVDAVLVLVLVPHKRRPGFWRDED